MDFEERPVIPSHSLFPQEIVRKVLSSILFKLTKTVIINRFQLFPGNRVSVLINGIGLHFKSQSRMPILDYGRVCSGKYGRFLQRSLVTNCHEKTVRRRILEFCAVHLENICLGFYGVCVQYICPRR